MPKYNLILNLPGFSIVKVSGYQPLILEVVYKRLARCSHCQSKKVRKKSSYIREVHHELIGHRRSLLRFKAYKLYCHDCGRYGNQQFPGINKHQRSTWRAQAAVFHEHSRGVSQKDLSERYKKGKATIERWYQRHYEEQHRELINKPCPLVLGIDEHFFSKKEGFATTLASWKDEVARMWRFSKSNGITEGFHRKMKLIQRRAYGFRNFENYRVRVKVLCG